MRPTAEGKRGKYCERAQQICEVMETVCPYGSELGDPDADHTCLSCCPCQISQCADDI